MHPHPQNARGVIQCGFGKRAERRTTLAFESFSKLLHSMLWLLAPECIATTQMSILEIGFLINDVHPDTQTGDRPTDRRTDRPTASATTVDVHKMQIEQRRRRWRRNVIAFRTRHAKCLQLPSHSTADCAAKMRNRRLLTQSTAEERHHYV